MRSISIINLLLLLSAVQCGSLYYNFLGKNSTFYECYHSAGFDRITLWLTQTNNTFNQQSIQNLGFAKNAGLNVDAAISPCRNRTVEMEVQMLARAFTSRVVDRFWLSLPENNNTACGWVNYPAASNCQYLQNLVNQIQNNLGYSVGINSNSEAWYKIFKDYQGCPEVSNMLLWWTPNNGNGQPNFNDYTKFGGWYMPYAKMYASKSICNTTLIESYYQQW